MAFKLKSRGRFEPYWIEFLAELNLRERLDTSKERKSMENLHFGSPCLCLDHLILSLGVCQGTETSRRLQANPGHPLLRLLRKFRVNTTMKWEKRENYERKTEQVREKEKKVWEKRKKVLNWSKRAKNHKARDNRQKFTTQSIQIVQKKCNQKCPKPPPR